MYAPIPYPCRRYPLTPPPSHTRMPPYPTPAAVTPSPSLPLPLSPPHPLTPSHSPSSHRWLRSHLGALLRLLGGIVKGGGRSWGSALERMEMCWKRKMHNLLEAPVAVGITPFRTRLCRDRSRRQDIKDALPHINETRGGRGCPLFETFERQKQNRTLLVSQPQSILV